MQAPKNRGLNTLVNIAALIPFFALVWAYWHGQLGPDVIGEATRRTGRYALAFLLLSLTPTVLTRAFGVRGIFWLRRLLGLYAFKYALLHFFIFVGWDYAFNFRLIALAIRDGRFVLFGLAAFLLLVPLAVTSTEGWVRRLGKNWERLHRAVYLASVLAVIHYGWVFKELRIMPVVAGAALLALLIARLPPVTEFLRTRRYEKRA
ncbi:MAG: hypothetical protein A2Y73_00305 [Chloroflexi bacterium RBG_13_56_8]|nr:MAG: hypothetical protein A2Y73_00305 [Chloroflexi bacterium RBG_13_56_8]